MQQLCKEIDKQIKIFYCATRIIKDFKNFICKHYTDFQGKTLLRIDRYLVFMIYYSGMTQMNGLVEIARIQSTEILTTFLCKRIDAKVLLIPIKNYLANSKLLITQFLSYKKV